MKLNEYNSMNIVTSFEKGNEISQILKSKYIKMVIIILILILVYVFLLPVFESTDRKLPTNLRELIRETSNNALENKKIETIAIAKPKYIIDNQDCDALKTIMRGIYLEHSANLPYNITQQIEELDKMVINYCIQQIYSELRGYVQYLHDASTLVVPIAPPIFSKLSDKQLELKPWF